MESHDELLRAADFAARKHVAQRRKGDDSPYINHPIGAARIIAVEGGCVDLVTLQAALLHDTVEDTQTTLDEIESEFGIQVREIVAEVTDDKTLSKAQRKQAQIDHARGFSGKGGSSPGYSGPAVMVKYGDKLHNCRSLEGKMIPENWSVKRVQGYIAWAHFVLMNCRKDGHHRQIEQIWDEFVKGNFHDREGTLHPRIAPDATGQKLEHYVKAYINSLDILEHMYGKEQD